MRFLVSTTALVLTIGCTQPADQKPAPPPQAAVKAKKPAPAVVAPEPGRLHGDAESLHYALKSARVFPLQREQGGLLESPGGDRTLGLLLSVRNQGSAPVVVDSTAFTLADEAGTPFASVNNGPARLFFGGQFPHKATLKPGQEFRGELLFSPVNLGQGKLLILELPGLRLRLRQNKIAQ